MIKTFCLFFVVSFVFISLGCGEQTNPSENRTIASETPSTGRVSDRDCPLFFKTQNLCASIQWLVGPSADEVSSFKLFFWNKTTGSASGPYTSPEGNVGSFIKMTCCGSVVVSSVTPTNTGEYTVSNVLFTPGTWKNTVKLSTGAVEEEQFELVTLDE